MEWDVGNGLRALLPSPSSRGEKGPQSWGLGLPLALGLDLKEKRLIRRREKLPAFFRTLGVAIVLERSSCDWLRPASFCRGLRRKMSLVPLRRKLTVGKERRLRQRKGHNGGEVGSREKTKHGGAEDSEQNQALGLETSLPSERKQRQNMPFILLEEKMVVFMGFCVYS